MESNRAFNAIAKMLHYSSQDIYKLKNRALKELDCIIAAEKAAMKAPSGLKLSTFGEYG